MLVRGLAGILVASAVLIAVTRLASVMTRVSVIKMSVINVMASVMISVTSP